VKREVSVSRAVNPIAQQRYLRGELRRARSEAGATQQEVANAMDWSLSKVIRLETGAVKVSVVDLRALLQHYGVSDAAKIDELVEIARMGKQHNWWDKYRKDLDANFVQYLELEAVAVRTRQFQSTTIPGLLQTREYARTLIAMYEDEADAIVEQFLEIRMKRQEVLSEDYGQEFFFILDESVLRRRIGTTDVMRRQLKHLVQLNRQSNVNIQVLPFTAGSHKAIRGSFTIVEFPIGFGDDVDFAVSLQRPIRDVLIKNDPALASEYVESFMSLEGLATPVRDLETTIELLLGDSE
jgi:transcriptional regulator with XRE-family HTH domain